jgi:hypothetical protein
MITKFESEANFSPRSSPDLTGWGIQLLLGKQ